MKKLVTLLMVLAMLVALVPAAMAGEMDTDYAAWFPGVDTSEHVVVTMLVTGNVPTNKTDEVLAVFNEKLTAAINAELRIQWIEWADWQTKYQLALAMQDGSIDLVGTATDWLYAWDNARNGGFMPLSEDMLAKYAPKTFASVSLSTGICVSTTAKSTLLRRQLCTVDQPRLPVPWRLGHRSRP